MLKKTKRCHSFAEGYKSDFGRFTDDFLAQHPEVEESRGSKAGTNTGITTSTWTKWSNSASTRSR